jgi:glutamine synthetase
MHIHQSVVDAKTGDNIFSAKDGSPTPLFFAHIAACRSTCRRRCRCSRRT